MSLTSYRAALSRIVAVVHEIYSAREIVLFFQIWITSGLEERLDDEWA
jgi:hypothetical protein